ncbi:MAG: carotenoid oxygenase family protein [Rubrivivax sp.]|nr:carotenoid oxygenase family protein [Rubrivivax sp.]
MDFVADRHRTEPPRAAAPTPSAVTQSRWRGLHSVAGASGEAAAPLAATVSGTLPPWLRGSLLLDGPAVWELSQASYRHWFDGLALLHRLHFAGDGSVRYHSRFLDTEDARLSRERGRPELGGYGTKAAGGLLSRLRHLANPRRTDNGCVVMSPCDGQWLALTESDRVTRFDPRTLATQGEWRWADKLKLPLMAAHPCIDAQGRWWNVGIQFGRTCEYVLIRADRRALREVKARIAVPRPGYLHAFALSARHAVIWECAWRAHPLRFLFAGESYGEHFDWMPQLGSRLHAVDLADGRVRSWEAPALFAFHAPQACEQGDDIVLDLCVTDGPVFEQLDLARLRAGGDAASAAATRACHMRYVLSPGAGRAREEVLPGRFELPQTHAAVAARGPVRYVWGAATHEGGGFFDRTVKLDHQTGRLLEAGDDGTVSLEPLFVPAPNARAEDDGVLLVHRLADGDSGSRIGVLDAATLAERAVVQLPAVVPFGFHGAWLPE